MTTPPAAPVDPHRTSLQRLLDEAPPRRPRCFDTDRDWHEFLLVASDSGERVVRRQDTGKWSGQRKVIPVFVAHVQTLPCADCSPDFRERMVQVGRCERVSPGNAARKWLKALLLSRGPMLASDIVRVARLQGFKRDSIYRAAQRIRVVRRRLDLIDQTTAQWSLS